jgi:hypothetical protein
VKDVSLFLSDELLLPYLKILQQPCLKDRPWPDKPSVFAPLPTTSPSLNQVSSPYAPAWGLQGNTKHSHICKILTISVRSGKRVFLSYQTKNRKLM